MMHWSDSGLTPLLDTGTGSLEHDNGQCLFADEEGSFEDKSDLCLFLSVAVVSLSVQPPLTEADDTSKLLLADAVCCRSLTANDTPTSLRENLQAKTKTLASCIDIQVCV